MTPSDLITLALKQAGVLGVGQPASAEDINDSFTLMKMMMAQWQRQRLMIYHLVETVFQATGALSYTVGTAGTIPMTRPSQIEAAFMRQMIPNPSSVDYPLEIIESREDYSRIALKSLASFPQYAFYDSAYPLGNLYIWPVPSDAYQIHLVTMEVLQQFASVNDVINMPAEYQEALLYNLAVRLFPLYTLPVNPKVEQLAQASKSLIETTNTQLSTLRMPQNLRRRGRYNIYADQ
jgi:hypothetical protein